MYYSIFDLIELFTPLDENYTVYLLDNRGNHTKIKLKFRRKKDATRSSQQNAQHGPSIKIEKDNIEKYIPIPLNVDTDDKIYKFFEEKINELSKVSSFRKHKDRIASIILDNQALLLAFWYTDIDNDKYYRVITEHIREKIMDPKYIKMKPKIKTKEEYEKDKVAVTQYIKDILQDDNVLVKFN